MKSRRPGVSRFFKFKSEAQCDKHWLRPISGSVIIFFSPDRRDCPCLSAHGKFRRNRAPCAARAACASMRPLGVCIYAVGSQSCAPRRERLRCARLAAAKLAAHGTSGVRRAREVPRPRSRFPRRLSRRLRGVSRRDASSAGYCLLASRRAPPRMRRTAPPRVAQLGLAPSRRFLSFQSGALLPLLSARLRRLVSVASAGAESAASEECGFAGVGGAMYAASGTSRGMAG